MIILGLTGSIGMGKSTTAKMFAREGIPVFDADETVHQLYQDNEKIRKAVFARFPEAKADGKIDRKILAQLVKKQDGALLTLEKIVHPAVEKKREAWLQKVKKAGESIVLFDIPLLFETGGESRADKIIVVSAPAKIQKQRVLSRPGMTPARFAHILSRQMPDKEKRKRADFVINTSKGLEDAARQVQSILCQLAEETRTGTMSVLKGKNVS